MSQVNLIEAQNELKKELRDSFGRHFTYLRLSLTDKCNFKCAYCLPNGYKIDKFSDCQPDLSLSEIKNLLSGFRRLGFRKVRLTGGEPTLRRDIVEIVSLAKDMGFETVGLSTNGYRLLNLLDPLKAAGLDQINVSIDSLDPKKFALLSGKDCGDQVILATHKAVAMNFRKVKVNAVLLRGINDQEFSSFLSWVQATPISLRFIELMPTNENREFFKKHHFQAKLWMDNLKQQGWTEIAKSQESGPAIELGHPSSKGELGFITPFQSTFCNSCNRLRVSSRGALRLCLFGQGELSLRSLLKTKDQNSSLIRTIKEAILNKKQAHNLNQGDSGDTRTLSSIGG